MAARSSVAGTTRYRGTPGGIGTDTPKHCLSVSGGNGITSLGGPGSVYGQLVNGPSPGPYPSLGFNTFYNGSSYLAGVAGRGGILQFQDGDGKFGFYSTESSVAAGAPQTFTPRLTIHSNGNVGIPTPVINAKFRVGSEAGGSDGVSGFSISGRGVFGGSTGGYGVYGYGQDNYAGYFAGSIRVEGTVVQGSDARLKQDVASLSYGLREVLRLRPVTWNWKARPDGGRQLGLIAQEVETVLPELVTTDKDAEQTKGLSYIGLVPVTIKAIQEQQTQIEDQRKVITER